MRGYIKIIVLAGLLLTTVTISYAHVGIDPTTTCSSPGSLDLSDHASQQVDSRIAGKSASNSLPLFSVRGTTAATTYVRNPLAWTNASTPLNLTGVTAWTSYDRTTGTMISPRHFVTATHYPVQPTSTVVFVDQNNVAYERTVVSTVRVVGPLVSGNNLLDMTVGVLNEDIPDSITYYPIMSPTVRSLLEKIEDIDVPIITMDQEKKALVRKLYEFGDWPIPNSIDRHLLSHGQYRTGPRAPFTEELIEGDSSSPSFMVIGGKLVLLTAETSGGGGDNYGHFINQINIAMTTLGGGYQVTEYQPTCFRQYPEPNRRPVFVGRSFQNHIAYRNFQLVKPITVFEATDPEGGIVAFELVGLRSVTKNVTLNVTNYFSINSATGELFQKANMDVLTLGKDFEITIRARDYGEFPAARVSLFPLKLIDANYPVLAPIVGLDPKYKPLKIEGTIKDVAFTTDQKAIVVGAFSKVNNQDHNGIVRLNADGSVDSAFTAKIGAGALTLLNLPATINSVKVRSDGKIYLGGLQEKFNNSTTGRLTRLNGDGSLDANFLSGSSSGFVASGERINDLLLIGDSVLVAGFLKKIPLPSQSLATNNGVLLVRNDGTLDMTFANNFKYGIDGEADQLLLHNGKIFIGGSFFGFQSLNGYYDSLRFMAISSQGVFDNIFSIGMGFGIDPWSVSSAVLDSAATSNGKIVLVGTFEYFGLTQVPHIVVLNANGTMDQAFNNRIGAGAFDDVLTAVAVQADGKILVGGKADILKGSVRGSLFRLNADGSVDTTFQQDIGTGLNGDIERIKVRPDGSILVTGNLYEYNGVKLNSSFVVLKPIGPDRTPPTGTVQINPQPASTATSLILTLNATDAESGMGVGAKMQFSNDGISWGGLMPYVTTATWNYSNSGLGLKTVYARFKDVAGNVSMTYSASITIVDKTAPAGYANVGMKSGNFVNLALYAYDSESGMFPPQAQMKFSNDNLTWSTPEAFASSKWWSPTPGSGSKTIYIKFKDVAGNWSSAYSVTTNF